MWYFFNVLEMSPPLFLLQRWHLWLSVQTRSLFELKKDRDVWVVQSVKHLTSAQVTTSRFMSSSPMSGSVLTGRSLEPASDSVSPSLLLPCSHSVSDSQKWIHVKKFKKKSSTHDLGSDPDLRVWEFEPCIGLCTHSARSLLEILSLPLSLPLPHLCMCACVCVCVFSLKINKHFF